MEDKENVTEVEETEAVEETSEVETKQEEVKQDIVEEKELSDDELYAKIQTEKMLKRKKVKKITTLSSLCFAFVLAVCLIVLAVVPVSLKPTCIAEGFSQVRLFQGTSPVGYFDNTITRPEDYAKFMKQYNDAFSKSYLTALFSGSLYSYEIKESLITSLATEDSIPPIPSEGGHPNLQSSTTYYAQLQFASDRVFTKQGGGVYTSRYTSGRESYWNGQLTYRYAYLVVNTDANPTATIYVVGKSPLENTTETQTRYHLLTVTVKADTSPIYQAWKDLTNS